MSVKGVVGRLVGRGRISKCPVNGQSRFEILLYKFTTLSAISNICFVYEALQVRMSYLKLPESETRQQKHILPDNIFFVFLCFRYSLTDNCSCKKTVPDLVEKMQDDPCVSMFKSYAGVTVRFCFLWDMWS